MELHEGVLILSFLGELFLRHLENIFLSTALYQSSTEDHFTVIE